MNAKPLLEWMHERQCIYLARQAGKPWPWSKDPIFRQFQFTNVYRENDTTTVWIRENWREPYAKHKNLWFAMCVARQIGWAPTLKEIGFPEKWEPERVRRTLHLRMASGEKTFTDAYKQVAGTSNRGIARADITIPQVLDPLWQWAQHSPPPFVEQSGLSLEAAARYFYGGEHHHFGFGDFLAYEVVTDLRHTRYLRNAPDINTWANAGPGAIRGLNRLHGRRVAYRLGPGQALVEMRELFRIVEKQRDKALLPTLEMRDIEMSCCELDKYMQAKEPGPPHLRKYEPLPPRDVFGGTPTRW